VLELTRVRGSSSEKLTSINAITAEGLLVIWDKTVGKYELTKFGYERLNAHRHKIATGV
jgi:hypothetical protein